MTAVLSHKPTGISNSRACYWCFMACNFRIKFSFPPTACTCLPFPYLTSILHISVPSSGTHYFQSTQLAYATQCTEHIKSITLLLFSLLSWFLLFGVFFVLFGGCFFLLVVSKNLTKTSQHYIKNWSLRMSKTSLKKAHTTSRTDLSGWAKLHWNQPTL